MVDVPGPVSGDSEPATNVYRNRLEVATGVPFISGNDIRLLNNGVEIFPSMLEAIGAASSSIDFETYAYWRGDIAHRFAEAFCDAARSGRRVRVLLDSYGARTMEAELVDLLQNSGVELRWFRPLASWRLWRTDKRTHRKILVCDDQIGFTGGVGIASEWEGDARDPTEWRDIQVRIDGPAVGGLRAAFLENWNESGPWRWDAAAQRASERPGGVAVQIVRASATVGWTDIATLMRSMVSIAEKRLRIATAYFVPDSVLIDLLESAIERGVRVEILIPGQHTDSRLSQLAGLAAIQRLVEGGAAVYRYERTMLHSKFLTVDGCLCCIGSPNLNHRSLGKDEECCAVISSRTVTGKLDRSFESDVENSAAVSARDLAQRGPATRAGEWLARRFIEQL